MTRVWLCVTMVMVVCVCLWGSAEAVGGAVSRPRPQRRPHKKPKVNPIDDTPPPQNIDIQQMGGTWYLVNAASKCNFLMKNGLKVEATVMTLMPPSSPNTALSVSTTTRLNHQCWEILQAYTITPTPGRLLLNGSRPLLNTEIVIGETDYSSYAVFYYQKQGQLTMKLYGRSKDTLSEAILDKFEDLAEKKGLGLAYVFAFPNYSHCQSVDKDHVITLGHSVQMVRGKGKGVIWDSDRCRLVEKASTPFNFAKKKTSRLLLRRACGNVLARRSVR
ncbi:complement component C8 gamma chain isoform X1 [Coregonus clupeaformis]|uniref:complement component C8 gamma chain isoform X1 n=1 Tax=Coregonus clupeaformis TaxID=59861 RepID=UPI001BDFE203|nr:complement component C8 gamma chain isoform X1 [Coregonus clupeaformis]